MIVRPAAAEDTPDILALWNAIIRETTVTFASVEKTPRTIADLVAARRAEGREVFAARDGGQFLGFATYTQFRAGEGYAHAMEHSVHIVPEARGRGVGRMLLEAVEEHARARGAHVLVAAISGENSGAIAFHRRMGFRAEARVPQAGRKFGRWLDLVLLSKTL
jgi:phosphinothricin acetyltransferase